MKIRRHSYTNFLLAALMVLCVAFFVISVIGNREPSYDTSARRFVAVICGGGYYWEDIEAGMAQADEELGTYTKYLTYTKLSMKEQLETLEQAQYMQPDGIITVGDPNSKKLKQKLQEIADSGIPVVLIDSDMPDTGECYVGTDNDEAGHLAAEKFLADGNTNHTILVVTSLLKVENQQARLDGFQAGLEEASDQTYTIAAVIDGKKDKQIIDEKVREAFEEHPDINEIFCEESSTATQIGTILQNDPELSEVKVICFDTNDSTAGFLKAGIFLGTIKQDGIGTGYEAVRYLNDRTQTPGQKVYLYRDITYIDKETDLS